MPKGGPRARLSIGGLRARVSINTHAAIGLHVRNATPRRCDSRRGYCRWRWTGRARRRRPRGGVARAAPTAGRRPRRLAPVRATHKARVSHAQGRARKRHTQERACKQHTQGTRV
eukprot:2915547-Prymnesium_polylepis.1